MDSTFWEAHASKADSNYNEPFATFIRDLARSLKCASVLEIGCNAGNDLRLVEGIQYGLDANPQIASMAGSKNAELGIAAGTARMMPYTDDSIDLVFTHGFFNYLEEGIGEALGEMHRVSARYALTCERFGRDDELDGGPARGRDMYERWLSYKVKVISNVEMHPDIDSQKPRFVLVKKLS